MKTLNVSVSSLKARLSEYLRMVRRGARFIVLEHKHPVAKLCPLDEGEPKDLVCIKPMDNTGLKGIFPVHKTKRKFSSLDLLMEDRRRR